jgi:hypothetical protein
MKYSIKQSLSSIVILSVLAFLPTSSSAEDLQRSYEQAFSFFNKREANAPHQIDRAIDILNQIENKSTNRTLNYDIVLLNSQAYFWKGFHAATREERKTLHEFGMEKAKAALQLNGELAEGYYAYAVNLARWGLAKGIIESLFRKGELEEYIKLTMDHVSRTGAPGDTVDGYGPYKILGRMYIKLPGFAGGSYKTSKEYLKTAHELAGDFAINTVYYAATLYRGNKEDKAMAKEVLEELLTKDPDSFNTERLPESKEALEEAKRLLDSKGSYDVQ